MDKSSGDEPNRPSPAPNSYYPARTHWMARQMGEITQFDIDVSRIWIECDSDDFSIPVAKAFLHKLFDMAERGLSK